MTCDVELMARQRRIREIEGLLAGAVVDGDPVGQPIARAGMVVTIRYDATGETDTFLLGRRAAEDTAITACSMASPLGRVIVGARPGDQRVYSIPDETGRVVTLLEAVPYELYRPRGHRVPPHVARTRITGYPK
jgi:transcription elongation GreA/GreB family factor